MEHFFGFLMGVNIPTIVYGGIICCISRKHPFTIISERVDNFYLLIPLFLMLPGILVIETIYRIGQLLVIIGKTLFKIFKNPLTFIHNLMMKNPADLIKFRIKLERK